MDTNPRYARAFIQGAVRLLWQRTPVGVADVALETAVELYLIARGEQLEPFDPGT